MNIGMILDNEFSGDLRVENEVYSLSKAGFNVFVLCFNHGGKQSVEQFYGAQIIRLNLSLFSKNKMKGLTNTFLDFYTIYWSKKIKWFVNKYKIDVLHVHDLYMLSPAYQANKALKPKLKIIADLHENYAAALKYYQFSNTFPGKYIVSIPKWEKSEKKWVNQADHVITVIEEAKDRYKTLGVEDNKISVVANYVHRAFFLKEFDEQEKEKRFANKFILSYIGGFDKHRGLETLMKAISILKSEIPEILLVLVGAGRNKPELIELSKELNLEKHVSFEGWQNPNRIPYYCHISDVCLIPHLKTEHTDNTIPHKLFQYMLLGKPVITSNCVPLKRILEETQSGKSFESNNEKSLAEIVLDLYKKPDYLEKMGINGKLAVQQKYNWQYTAKELVALYNKLKKEIQIN